ncbi:MAG: glutaminyl-peptide cyclotransferase [Thermoanaerobaculales bacterium]|nr:glutaminyl-peptide cyclotransferase [Thermoanaerobaculales bacterium]
MAGRVLIGLAAAVLWAAGPAAAQAPVCTVSVVANYPHDEDAFTQGLVYADGELFESTGLYGESSLRRVELTTGAVLQQVDLSPAYFAEGLTMWEDELVQLTWRENTGFVRDATTFDLEAIFPFAGEGWGLTHDGRVLILSDGTSHLRFLDPESHAELGSQAVADGLTPIDMLNELELIRGEVFANVYLTDEIVRIDPDTGRVVARIDLTILHDDAGALNGIAWDDAGERLFVTGKNWPTLYQVEMVGCPELRLFGDGFESGGFTRWSAAAE